MSVLPAGAVLPEMVVPRLSSHLRFETVSLFTLSAAAVALLSQELLLLHVLCVSYLLCFFPFWPSFALRCFLFIFILLPSSVHFLALILLVVFSSQSGS